MVLGHMSGYPQAKKNMVKKATNAAKVKKQSFLKDETIVGDPMKYYVILCLVLFAFWLLLSGKFEPKFLFYGVATSVVSAYVCMPLLLIPSKDGKKKFYAFGVSLGKFALYWIWLMREVVNANLDVERAVVRPEMEINPMMVSFKMPYENPMAHATLANSITLTPGTITVDVSEDGVYLIHALTDGAREGLLSGGMQQKIAELFGETCEFAVLEGGEQHE